MRWKVTGAVEQTGEDVEKWFDAKDRDEAEAKAKRAGILVATIAPESAVANVGTLQYREPTTPKPAPVPSPPPPIPATAVQVNPVRQEETMLGWAEQIVAIALLATAAVLFGVGWQNAHDRGSSLYRPGRFQDDNAIGATANRLEEIREEAKVSATNLRGVVQFTAGLVALCGVGLIRLRGTIRLQRGETTRGTGKR
jgi:hypothetical protein